MLYKTFIFNLGYAEEQMMTSLVVVNWNGFATIEDGIKSFLKAASKAMREDWGQEVKPVYDGEPILSSYLESLFERRSHEVHPEVEEIFEEEGWDFWFTGFPEGKMAYVPQLDTAAAGPLEDSLKDSITAILEIPVGIHNAHT